MPGRARCCRSSAARRMRAPGLKAPLATVGAQLPAASTIKAAKLRGVESNGMLCSAKELGHRCRCVGPAGTARRCAGRRAAGRIPRPARREHRAQAHAQPRRLLQRARHRVRRRRRLRQRGRAARCHAGRRALSERARRGSKLQAGADAPRYVGRVIEGVDADAHDAGLDGRAPASRRRAPDQPARRRHPIRDARTRPADARVRRDLLHGPIGVRRARAGETLKLLDGRDVDAGPRVPRGHRRRSQPIGAGRHDGRLRHARHRCDAQRFPRGRAFRAAAIIGRGRKLGLHTDAGHRFERGVDPRTAARAPSNARRV